MGAYTWPKNPLKSEEIPEKERDGGGDAGKAKGLEEVKKPDHPGNDRRTTGPPAPTAST